MQFCISNAAPSQQQRIGNLRTPACAAGICSSVRWAPAGIALTGAMYLVDGVQDGLVQLCGCGSGVLQLAEHPHEQLEDSLSVRTPPAIGLHGCLPGLERRAGNRRMHCLSFGTGRACDDFSPQPRVTASRPRHHAVKAASGRSELACARACRRRLASPSRMLAGGCGGGGRDR